MITVAKDEDEGSSNKTPVERIAHEVYEYADETVGHAEGVPRDELMLACYHKLGLLMADWAKKLDRIDVKRSEPTWMRKFAKLREENNGISMMAYDTASLGFEVDGMFFAEDKSDAKRRFSDDLLMVSQPYSMLKEDFKSLIEFCEENNLDFYVDGFNTRQPGRAFRVTVYHLKLGSKPLSRKDYREKVLGTLLIFSELSTDSDGRAQSVERRVILDQMLRSGLFMDLTEASDILYTLEKSGQIPKSRILD